MKRKIKVYFDKGILERFLSRGKNGRTLATALRDPVEERILDAQRKLIKNFEEDEISQEIAAGPDVMDNPSGTLGGYGGLFSFIGFMRGDDPIGQVIDLLSQRITFSVKTIGILRFQIATNFVSKDELFKATPIPWASGRSWLDGIEKGISGLGRYLNTTKELEYPPSRSGRGIQVKHDKLRAGKFQNRSYISKYLKEFEREVSKA